MSNPDSPDRKPRFAIFRHDEASPDQGIPIMRHEPMTEIMAEGGRELREAGISEGHENRLLFSGAGMSLVYAWFKSGYPLPRHSHDSDCLYYIVAGSLQLGDQTLGPGDGFFIGGDAPYTYVTGPEGLEILEFRATEAFNIKLLANNPKFWQRAVATVEERRPSWAKEEKPSTRSTGTAKGN